MSRTEALRAWSQNPDGAGILSVEPDGIRVLRSMGFRSFWRKYRQTDDHTLRVVHFRWRTSGEDGIVNVHPFRIGTDADGGWMMHNGVMTAACILRPERSDTAAVAAALRTIPMSHILSDAFRPAMMAMLGAGKLVIVTDSGDYHILGESRGEWSGASRWYSAPRAPARIGSAPALGAGFSRTSDDDDDDIDVIIGRYAFGWDGER